MLTSVQKSALGLCLLFVVLSFAVPAKAQTQAQIPLQASTQAQSQPQRVSLADLVNDAAKWNNKSVELTGEAIGDIMRRGNYAWLNVSQGGVALGLWGNKELFGPITHLGDYSQTGDSLRIIGEFHLACPEHGGDMDVHITALQVVEPGIKTEHPVQPLHVWFSVAGMAAAAILALILRLRNRKGLS